MNRRDVIKQTCGMGLCVCAGSTLMSQVCGAAEVPDDADRQLRRLQWWQDHTKSQMAKLWELLEPHLDEKTRDEIVEQLGRNCAKRLGWAKQFKGDLPGFFQRMKDSQGEDLVLDEASGIITVTSPEREDCTCGLVNKKTTPPYFCHCSVGWQKETYETILGKKVDVEIVESVLHGGKRCVFKIRIL
jgi:predicted hydrocarbon binding protein